MSDAQFLLEADPFVIKSTRVAYENAWIKVEHQEVIRPDGQPGIYGIIRFANSTVAVLPVEANGDVWMIGQWRRPLENWSWEIPEGGVPSDEDAIIGAHRELEEEAGVKAGQMIKLLDFDVSNSVTDEVGTAFLAYELSQGVKAPDPTEVLGIRRVHFMDLLEEVNKGLIRDTITLVTVLRAYQLAVTGKLPQSLAESMLQKPLGE